MRGKEMPFKLNFLKFPHSPSGISRRRPFWVSLLVGFLFILVTAYLLFIPQQKTIIDQALVAGDIVKEDIIINKSITVEDKENTERNRRLAAENVIPVYRYYPENQKKARDSITRWFRFIRESRKDYIKNKKTREELKRIKTLIEGQLGLEFTENEIRVILESQFFNKVDLDQLLNLVKSFYDTRILTSLTGADQGKDGSIQLFSRPLEGGETSREPVILKIDQVYDLKKAKTRLLRFIKQQPFRTTPEEFIVSVLMQFIEPNVFYSLNLTQEAKQIAAAAVNPVLIKLKAGKVILRKGDEVKPEDLRILNLIAFEDKRRERKLSDFYLILLILGFLTLFGGKFFNIWSSSGINMDKLFTVTGATLLVSVIVYRASLFLFPLILSNTTLDIQYDIYSIFYAIPFGFGVMVIAFIFNLQSAVIFSFANALVGGIVCGWDFNIFLYVLLGNLAVSYGIEYYERIKRSPIIKAAVLWLLPVNLITLSLFHLTQSDFTLMHLSVSVLMGIFSALISPILANFIIPVWEVFFNLITELKLIELTNLNLPIFREMLEKAPGTYHHSQMVSSLSEAAAQDLGLSPLLQRAMALYHDIGKINNPHFFTENHTIYQNPHPKLPPRESAKNITSHLSDGMERAEKLKLPPIVKSSITQHHGTKRVHYFFDKAREMSSIASDGFDDKVFRYQGEKPKNIENAIIMLADQVEAASKSLAAPTDEDIKNVIQKIIDANIEEGQFEECEGLTFKALNTIANSFLKKLSSIYHMRISYPGFDFKEKKEKETVDQQLQSGRGAARSTTDRLKTVS
jgi:putative nucleotidyltransferase with HDIG domain